MAGAGSTLSLAALYSGSRVLVVGENHVNSAARQEFSRSLGDLKKKGVTDLTLEMPSDFQKDLDDFSSGKIDRNGLEQRFKNSKYFDADNRNIIADTANMVEQAKKNGMKVHATDITREEFDKTDEDAKQFNRRNEVMAGKIADIVKDPDRKVVHYGGKGHTGKKSEYEDAYHEKVGTINQELEKKGIESQSVDFAGGTRPAKNVREPDKPVLDSAFAVEKQAAERGLGDKRFIIQGNNNADVIVHQPQKNEDAQFYYDQKVKDQGLAPAQPAKIKPDTVPPDSARVVETENNVTPITAGMKRGSLLQVTADAKKAAPAPTPEIDRGQQEQRAA